MRGAEGHVGVGSQHKSAQVHFAAQAQFATVELVARLETVDDGKAVARNRVWPTEVADAPQIDAGVQNVQAFAQVQVAKAASPVSR